MLMKSKVSFMLKDISAIVRKSTRILRFYIIKSISNFLAVEWISYIRLHFKWSVHDTFFQRFLTEHKREFKSFP